jgi:hypothetical protein
MKPQVRRWLYGLSSGFIGGMAGAVDSGLALLIIAPSDFNLGPHLRKTLLTVLVLGLLTGVKVAFAYLKQSPLPPAE